MIQRNYMRDEVMWKNHKKELIGCIASAIGIVLLVLLMVTVFEYFGIHVPGTREMWIGLIGAVIGGVFTLLGVLITIYHQEESEKERRRLENMPILGFEVSFNNYESDTVLTYTEGELITSGFFVYESKVFATFYIRTVNNLCTFNYRIEGCAINGKSVILGSAFNPATERLLVGETIDFVFDIEGINTNVFCLLRFAYQDIFGNQYYQDLPFIYEETGSYQGMEGRIKQIIELRDIKQPVLCRESKSLEEASKEYVDYDVFCKKQLSTNHQ